MIVKELDRFVDRGDVFARAGHQAEKQMAYYLHRAFGESQSGVYVLNDLRLERDGDAAQIDHLIIHHAGMVIIESKSVHGTVRVNEQGEWVRVFGSRREGMPSPIEQAQRQALFLKRFLNDHASQIGGKLLGLIQAHFGALTVDVVVAVSDSGVIERPKKRQLPEVCKADQAVAKVQELLARQKREASVFTMDFKLNSGRALSRTEISNLLALLPACHSPRVANPAPMPVAIIEAQNVSRKPIEESVVTTAAAAVAEKVGEDRCYCAACQKQLSPKEEQYCRDKASRFGEKFYCYQHQRFAARTAK